MNQTVPISNETSVFSQHDQELTSIRRLVAKSDKHFDGYRQSLYQALEDTFKFTNRLVDEDAAAAFVGSQGGDWGKVAKDNPFQPIVALAFKDSSAASAISKYALVLKYAREAKPPSKGIATWIEENGGIEKLVTLARLKDQQSWDNLYQETEEEHLQRAYAELRSTSLGHLAASSGKHLSDSTSFNGYGRALVRQVNGRLEVVRVLPVKPEDVRTDLFRLVPAEQKYTRRKLTQKPLYELFRVADMASRFFGNIPAAIEADDEEKTVTSLDASPSENAKALVKKAKARSARASANLKAANKQRYFGRMGLRFQFVNGRWQADTIGTLPTFPVLQYQLSEELRELERSKTYYLSSHQSERLAQTFATVRDWTLRVRQPALSGTYDASAPDEVVFDELTSAYAWRELAQPRSTTASFSLSREKLQALRSWLEEYKNLAKGKTSFPKLLALRYGNSQLLLQFPDFRELTPDARRQLPEPDRAVHDLQRLELSALQLGSGQTLDERFLVYSDIKAICKLSDDYGLSFNAALWEMNEHIAALSLEAGPATIVVPLSVSLAGQYAGIVDLL